MVRELETFTIDPASRIPESNHQSSEEEASALMDCETIIRTGWLYKRGGRTRAWKKRWFVLRRDHFAYYKDQREYETRKVLPVEALSGISSKSRGKRANISFYVLDKEVHLETDSQEDAEGWVQALKMAVKLDDYQKSGPTSPVAIKGRPRSMVPDMAGSSHSRLFATSAGTSPISPPLMLNTLPNSLPFSDDELSATALSDEDFTSPLSATTSLDHPGADYIPTRSVTERAKSDKVIVQGYLRRHFNSRRRGSTDIWAVLRPYGLYLYPDHNEYSPSKIVPMSEVIDASDLSTDTQVAGSQTSTKRKKFRFQVITGEKAMRFSVDREVHLDEWLGGLKSRLEIEEKKRHE